MRNRLLGFILIACLAQVGCNRQWLDLSLKTPAAHIASVAVVEETPEASRLAISVELINPNDVDLPLKLVNYRLKLEGQDDVSFNVPPVATLPAMGRQTVVVPAVVAATGLSGRAYKISGSIDYEPPGEIRDIMTDSGVPLPWSSFSAEGKLR